MVGVERIFITNSLGWDAFHVRVQDNFYAVAHNIHRIAIDKGVVGVDLWVWSFAMLTISSRLFVIMLLLC